MRILKGYNEDEQKELEYAKKHIDCNDLLHIITDFISGTRFDLIWSKYNESEPDEQISIIRDILDFYTDKAKIPEEKYVVHDKTAGQYIYYSVKRIGLFWGQLGAVIPDKKTKDEWLAINPAYEAMLEKVED